MMKVRIVEVFEDDAYYELADKVVGLVGKFKPYELKGESVFSGEFYPAGKRTILGDVAFFFKVKLEGVE